MGNLEMIGVGMEIVVRPQTVNGEQDDMRLDCLSP